MRENLAVGGSELFDIEINDIEINKGMFRHKKTVHPNFRMHHRFDSSGWNPRLNPGN